MGFFDFVGDVLSSTINGVESAIDGAGSAIGSFSDGVGDILSSTIDGVGGAVDYAVENPGKALLTVGATVATGGLAAPAIAVTAAGKTLAAEAVTASVVTLASLATSDAYNKATKKEDDND